jgi:hypothetical protein
MSKNVIFIPVSTQLVKKFCVLYRPNFGAGVVWVEGESTVGT